MAEREQVRWILYGSVLASFPLAYAMFLAVFRPSEFGGGAATWPMFAASVCFTGAFAVSITRYRLMQLDQLVSSGHGLLPHQLPGAAVYYVLVFAGTLVVGGQGVAGPSLEQAFWVSGTALVLMVGLDLARSRLRRALDRRFRREKTQLDRTLHRWARRSSSWSIRRRWPGGCCTRPRTCSACRPGPSTCARATRRCTAWPAASARSPPLPELPAGCPLVAALATCRDDPAAGRRLGPFDALGAAARRRRRGGRRR